MLYDLFFIFVVHPVVHFSLLGYCNQAHYNSVTMIKAFRDLLDYYPDFWLNMQRRHDIWRALHSPKQKARIENAKPFRRNVGI